MVGILDLRGPPAGLPRRQARRADVAALLRLSLLAPVATVVPYFLHCVGGSSDAFARWPLARSPTEQRAPRSAALAPSLRRQSSEAAVEWRTPKQTQKEEQWPFWPALPIAPYDRRRTIRRELVLGQLWSFEQKQGVYYVHVPIRMTVYRLQSRRGLFVYAPVAPTDECVALLRELEEQYGEVAYIVLPTVAVEHKYFVGPFSRSFPRAEVWVCPGQFSVPLPLPLTFLGFPSDRLHVLPSDPRDPSVPAEWREEGLDYRLLGPIGKDLSTGAFAEAVFYVRRLKTLLATDLVLSVPTEIPEILLEDPRALAFHARDGPLAPVDTSPASLAKGWKRICIFSLLFRTSAIEVQSTPEAVRDAIASKAQELGWAGFLPCNYRERWEETFQALTGGGEGGLLVPPILSELVLNRYLSSDVWPFVEAVAEAWPDMEQIVPAHFAAPVRAGAQEWRDAFRRAFGEPPASPGPFGLQLPGFLAGGPRRGPQPKEEDLGFIRGFSEDLTSLGVVDAPERLTYLAGLEAEAK